MIETDHNFFDEHLQETYVCNYTKTDKNTNHYLIAKAYIHWFKKQKVSLSKQHTRDIHTLGEIIEEKTAWYRYRIEKVENLHRSELQSLYNEAKSVIGLYTHKSVHDNYINSLEQYLETIEVCKTYDLKNHILEIVSHLTTHQDTLSCSKKELASTLTSLAEYFREQGESEGRELLYPQALGLYATVNDSDVLSEIKDIYNLIGCGDIIALHNTKKPSIKEFNKKSIIDIITEIDTLEKYSFNNESLLFYRYTELAYKHLVNDEVENAAQAIRKGRNWLFKPGFGRSSEKYNNIENQIISYISDYYVKQTTSYKKLAHAIEKYQQGEKSELYYRSCIEIGKRFQSYNNSSKSKEFFVKATYSQNKEVSSTAQNFLNVV